MVTMVISCLIATLQVRLTGVPRGFSKVIQLACHQNWPRSPDAQAKLLPLHPTTVKSFYHLEKKSHKVQVSRKQKGRQKIACGVFY